MLSFSNSLLSSYIVLRRLERVIISSVSAVERAVGTAKIIDTI